MVDGSYLIETLKSAYHPFGSLCSADGCGWFSQSFCKGCNLLSGTWSHLLFTRVFECPPWNMYSIDCAVEDTSVVLYFNPRFKIF